MRRLCSLLPLLVLAGCPTIAGTEAGGPCNDNHICVDPLSCDVEQNICLSPDQSVWASLPTTVSSSLNAVWGISDTEFFAVGAAGTILHYVDPDTQWREDTDAEGKLKSPGSTTMHAVWGRGKELWIGGEGALLYYNGNGWTAQQVLNASSQPATEFSITGLAGQSTGPVWAVGSVDSGAQVFKNATGTGSWTVEAKPPFEPSGIAVVGQTIVVVGPSTKQVWMYTGKWAGLTTGTTDTVSLSAAWGSAPDNIWAVGSTLLHYNGSVWSTNTANKQLPGIAAISGRSSGEFYLVSGDSYSSTGNAFTCTAGGACLPLTIDSTTSHQLNGVWCSDSTVVVVGDNGITFRRTR